MMNELRRNDAKGANKCREQKKEPADNETYNTVPRGIARLISVSIANVDKALAASFVEGNLSVIIFVEDTG